jgi:hypothetical protein
MLGILDLISCWVLLPLFFCRTDGVAPRRGGAPEGPHGGEQAAQGTLHFCFVLFTLRWVVQALRLRGLFLLPSLHALVYCVLLSSTAAFHA